MEIFTITETFWNEDQEEMTDTGRVIGYRVTSRLGAVISEGESLNEAMEKALIATYSESV